MTLNQWILLAPELSLLCMACTILIADLFVAPRYKFITSGLVLASIAGAAYACWPLLNAPTEILFSSHWIIDGFTQHLKIFTLGVLFLAVLYGLQYNKEAHIHQGELYVLMLLSTLGMFTIISAHTTLMLYLGLELLALGSYAMVAITHEREASIEAAMKYFVLGAVSSAMLLYGLSLLYGASGGHLVISEIPAYLYSIPKEPGNMYMMNFSIVFILVGIAFKFGVAPFHLWVPDVYQGAPTSVTTFIAAVPKMAAFALIYRLLLEVYPQFVQYWQPLVLGLGVVSIVVGNLFAIAQTSMKRLLAYSSISHMGFVFLGVATFGVTESLFYLFAYSFTILAGFGVLLSLRTDGYEIDQLSDFKALSKQAPLHAFVMLLVMFSLAGIPPLLGFFAKFSIIWSLIKAGQMPTAIVALVMSVIGAYYYLRVVKLMYFDTKSTLVVRGRGVGGLLETSVLTINGLALILLGLFPALFLGFATQAFLPLIHP